MRRYLSSIAERFIVDIESEIKLIFEKRTGKKAEDNLFELLGLVKEFPFLESENSKILEFLKGIRQLEVDLKASSNILDNFAPNLSMAQIFSISWAIRRW